MAVYNPPTEYNPIFNTSNFITPITGLTESRANSLYLSKVNTDSTNAGVASTTFINIVNASSFVSANFNVPTANTPTNFLTGLVSGTASICTGVTTGTINIGTAITSGLINQGKTTFNNTVTVANGQTFYSNLVKSTAIVPDAHTLFDNMPAGSSITIGNQLSGSSIALKGAVSVGTYGTAGGVLTLYRKLNIQDINGNATGFAEIYYGNGSELGYYSISVPTTLNQTFHRFWNCDAGSTTPILRLEVGNAVTITDGTILNTRQIKSTSTASTAHTLFDNMTTGGVLAIGNTASSNTINGNTNFVSSVALKNNRYKICEQLDFTASPTYTITIPMSQTYTIRSAFTAITITLPSITVVDAGTIINLVKVAGSSNIAATINNTGGFGINTIYTQNDLAVGSFSNTTLLGLNKMATTLMAAATTGGFAYWLEINGASTYDIAQNNLTYARLSTENNFTNRLNFTGATYSFPFSSSQSLGYYQTFTGTGQVVTSGTAASILTTTSIPIGVWRVDFSVKNTVVVPGGIITSAQSYIALSSTPTTPLTFTGALVRSDVSESYSGGDIQILTSSFTLNASVAQTYVLTIFRTISGAPQFTFLGEMSITRIA
jgi:hypothetical protein